MVAGLVSGLSGDWPGFVIISFDAVDEADPARPHAWDMRAVLRFTLVMRPLSPVVDLATSLGLALGPLAPLLGFPPLPGALPGAILLLVLAYLGMAERLRRLTASETKM